MLEASDGRAMMALYLRDHGSVAKVGELARFLGVSIDRVWRLVHEMVGRKELTLFARRGRRGTLVELISEPRRRR